MMRSWRGGWLWLLWVVVLVAGSAGACGGGSHFAGDASVDGGADALFPDVSFAEAGGTLVLDPPDPVLDVNYGQTTPTVTFSAKTPTGAVVAATFTLDRGELGAVGSTSGVFSPSGSVGGTGTVTAAFQGATGSTTITVHLHMAESGGAPCTPDAFGCNGVGGEGPGAAPSAAVKATLLGTPTADASLGWLYPYDQTLWPRGVLAPLLQWNAGSHNFDGVYIHLSEKAFDYAGTFASTATPFVHHPIPQAAWNALTESNQGEAVTATLVFSEGGTAYGPITETWEIAGGSLTGTVYYNSYGTSMVQNDCCIYNTTTRFGGAILAIKPGATAPVVVDGHTSSDSSGCRVCHTVSADGSRLFTNYLDTLGNDKQTEMVDLKTNTVTQLAGNGLYAWGAPYRDGSFIFSSSYTVSGLQYGLEGSSSVASQLYSMPQTSSLASTGLPTLNAAMPVFSPDGKHVAFNYQPPAGDATQLAVMDYDAGTSTFSNFRVLWKPPSGAVVWPSFLPTSDALIVELETVSNGRDFGGTRGTCNNCTDGAHGELWWIDLATQTPTRLDQLNGLGYMPTGPNNHGNDTTLNYEPTVAPIVSGGYAWVVFTSRRLYGNVATLNPYFSDPRFVPISFGQSANPNSKKLWVAPISLNAAPGTDPSHRAFYLGGQELFSANARGYWVLDPCKQNGQTCASGDQCCGGYCEASGDAGLVCGSTANGCAKPGEKCSADGDCCNAAQNVKCIDGFCASPPVN